MNDDINTPEDIDAFRARHVANCGLACTAVRGTVSYVYSTSLMVDVDGVPCELVVANVTGPEGHTVITHIHRAWKRNGYGLGTTQRLVITDNPDSADIIYTLSEITDEDDLELFYTRDALTEDREGFKTYMVTVN